MNSLGRYGSKPGLARIGRLLSALGHPEKKFKCILVAGTNGKGSTTTFLASALSASHFKTGSYFSPHVFSFRERIRVNGKNISKKELLACARPVLSLLPSMRNDAPTFFEAATAIALLHFSRQRVGYAVLEVGLGGRLDATNAVSPVLSILTSIGLEHTDVLGNTMAKIAREKAGILRAGVPAVCAVRDEKARAVILSRAKKLRAPLYDVKKPVSFPLRASGFFQRQNAATAMQAARLLGLPPSLARRAIADTRVLARWQKISSRPAVLLDCAHNPPAITAISGDLERDFHFSPSSPRILLFASMRDKDYPAMLRLLLPHFDAVVLCRPPFARAEKIGKLEKAAKKRAPPSRPFLHAIKNPKAALAFSRRLATPKGRVLACGSIYLLASLFGEPEFRLTS